MSPLLIWLLRACLYLASAASTFQAYLRIIGSPLASLNGVYACTEAGNCLLGQYVLRRSLVLVEGGVSQVRWYLSEAQGEQQQHARLFGCAEFASSSSSSSCRWKDFRRGEFVRDMHMQDVYLECLPSMQQRQVEERMWLLVDAKTTKTSLAMDENTISSCLSLLFPKTLNASTPLAPLAHFASSTYDPSTSISHITSTCLCAWAASMGAWPIAKSCYRQALALHDESNDASASYSDSITRGYSDMSPSQCFYLANETLISRCLHRASMSRYVCSLLALDVDPFEVLRVIDLLMPLSTIVATADGNNETTLLLLRGARLVAQALLGRAKRSEDGSTSNDNKEKAIGLICQRAQDEAQRANATEIHTLLLHACHLLLSLPSYSLEQLSPSLVVNLLGLGAVKEASFVASHAFVEHFNDEQVNALITSALFAKKGPTKPGQREHVHAAQLLLDVLTLAITTQASDVVGKSPSLSLLLSVLLQVTSPVVMQATARDSVALNVTTELRSIAIQFLDTMLNLCNSTPCTLNDPPLSIGVRGLFLLAYQGGALTKTSSYFLDFIVPSKYRELMLLTHPEWPWYPPLSATTAATAAVGSTTNKVRVGFLSSFFRTHPVGRLLARIITGLDASRFDVHVINVGAREMIHEHDTVAQYLKNGLVSEAQWHMLPANHLHAADTVSLLSLDVLVFGDVFMDAVTTHLAMLRLATTTIAFWGHPFTSGFASIDYFVSSDLFEEGYDRHGHFAEQLVRFDSLSFLMFRHQQHQGKNKMHKPKDDGSFLRRVLSLHGHDIHGAPFVLLSKNGMNNTISFSHRRIYGCLQSLMKMHPLFDLAILGILEKDPTALVLVSNTPSQRLWQSAWQQRLLGTACEIFGLDLGTRLVKRIAFVDQLPHLQYAQLVCTAHVTLDPFPFGGGVTLTDSMACRVPFVTLGELQSVHAIGKGMSKHHLQQNKHLAVRVHFNNVTSTLRDSNELALIDAYVLFAIAKAKAEEAKAMANVDKLRDDDGGDDDVEPEDVEAVVDEWQSLLFRCAQRYDSSINVVSKYE